MFPAATAITVARNVARRGVFSHFCLWVQVLLSLATFSHGLSRSAVTEARRRATVCHGWFYVSSRPGTFCWDLSCFVTLRSSSATSIKNINTCNMAMKKPISYLYNCYERTSGLCGSKEATSSCIEE